MQHKSWQRQARRYAVGDRAVVGGHVDENEPPREMRPVGCQGPRCDPAGPASRHDRRARAHLRENGPKILDMRGEIPRLFGCRLTQAEVHDSAPRKHQRVGDIAPRGAFLSDLGDQENRRIILVAQHVGRQNDAAETLIFDEAQTSPLPRRRAITPAAFDMTKL